MVWSVAGEDKSTGDKSASKDKSASEDKTAGKILIFEVLVQVAENFFLKCSITV